MPFSDEPSSLLTALGHVKSRRLSERIHASLSIRVAVRIPDLKRPGPGDKLSGPGGLEPRRGRPRRQTRPGFRLRVVHRVESGLGGQLKARVPGRSGQVCLTRAGSRFSGSFVSGFPTVRLGFTLRRGHEGTEHLSTKGAWVPPTWVWFVCQSTLIIWKTIGELAGAWLVGEGALSRQGHICYLARI